MTDDFDDEFDGGLDDADMLSALDQIESRPQGFSRPPTHFISASKLPFAPRGGSVGKPFSRPASHALILDQNQNQYQNQNPTEARKQSNQGFRSRQHHPTPRQQQQSNSKVSVAAAIAKVGPLPIEIFDHIPSDAFLSSPGVDAAVPRQHFPNVAAAPLSAKPWAPPAQPGQGQREFSRTHSGPLRQTTLFGATLPDAPIGDLQTSSSSSSSSRPFKGNPQPKTQHDLDWEALETWVYPTNLGAIRDYQFTIVKQSLFNNTLVALPTGLGKTFIAATVMLNFYRWTKKGKLVFVAPTKPLVSQQTQACFDIAGIPRSDTTHLNGAVTSTIRAEEWRDKRVFFMTPQTLMNDLSTGIADPKSIALMVIDEAHRATGEYAYAKVIRFMRKSTNDFRVLALTATPGSTIETVQEVINNLGISHIEIRTEDSMDIRQYVHQRDIEQVVLDHSDEIVRIRELFTQALKPMVEKLSAQNIYYARDPMNFTAFGLMKARQDWMASQGRSANQGLKMMMMAVFGLLTSVAHSIKLLNFHGIKPFYDNMLELRRETEANGNKGSKYKKQLVSSSEFTEMMDLIGSWIATDVVGHPKLSHTVDTILNHFMDNKESADSNETKAIVFSEYRDSAEEIVRVLNLHRPLVRAAVFVGQADSKRSEGMKQAQQLKTIEDFKSGVHNVLVATSIGEEGLDIGQVDLIVCYDASSSPIRMLQRMGRTGRKRSGRIVLLLMRGKEEDAYRRSKDTYAGMQALICEGSRFDFRTDLSMRIVPAGVYPEVDKRHVSIPVENTQLPSSELPIPTRRRGAAPMKKPPKPFHMPENVETGFKSVSELLGAKPKTAKDSTAIANETEKKKQPKQARQPKKARPTNKAHDSVVVVEVPPLSQVLLSPQEEAQLRASYLRLPDRFGDQETTLPDMTACPLHQRVLRPCGKVQHGQKTRRVVQVLQKMAKMQASPDEFGAPHNTLDGIGYADLPMPEYATDTEDEGSKKRSRDDIPIALSDDTAATEAQPLPKRQKVATPRNRPTASKAPKVIAANPKPESAKAKIKTKPKTKTKANAKPKTKRSRAPIMAANPFIADAAQDNSDPLASSQPTPGPNADGKRTSLAMRCGINSDEVGDDCERESDAYMSDGDDDGSDLVGFVVSDDRELSTVEEDDDSGGIFFTSTPATAATPQKDKSFFNRDGNYDDGGSGMDTDEELPDVVTLIASSPPIPRSAVVVPPSSSDVPVARTIRSRRPAAIFDSDDE